MDDASEGFFQAKTETELRRGIG